MEAISIVSLRFSVLSALLTYGFLYNWRWSIVQSDICKNQVRGAAGPAGVRRTPERPAAARGVGDSAHPTAEDAVGIFRRVA